MFSGTIRIRLSVLFLLVVMTATANAVDDFELTDKIKNEIIDSICIAIDSDYLWQDSANGISKQLRSKDELKTYEKYNDLDGFLQAIDNDLGEISADGHLHVWKMRDYEYGYLINDTIADKSKAEDKKKDRSINFGFEKYERLPGNIGYLDLRQFCDLKTGAETAVAFMKILSNSDAVIIDLRNNGGGDGDMVQLLASYFFDRPSQLTGNISPRTDSLAQIWSYNYLPGNRLLKQELYILMSRYSFSAAEDFAYTLQALNRATIVGEQTRGGAHPIKYKFFPNLHTAMLIPIMESYNPITKSNWEGIGVVPDMEIKAAKALEWSQYDALKKLLEITTNKDDIFSITWAIRGFKAKLNPVSVPQDILKSYAGLYGERRLIYENDKLYYQRGDRPKYEMISLGDQLFGFKEFDYFRLKIILDEQGSPIEVQGSYDDGNIDRSPKSN